MLSGKQGAREGSRGPAEKPRLSGTSLRCHILSTFRLSGPALPPDADRAHLVCVPARTWHSSALVVDLAGRQRVPAETGLTSLSRPCPCPILVPVPSLSHPCPVPVPVRLCPVLSLSLSLSLSPSCSCRCPCPLPVPVPFPSLSHPCLVPVPVPAEQVFCRVKLWPVSE